MNARFRPLAWLFATLVPLPAQALVKDINPRFDNTGSGPSSLIPWASGNRALFFAADARGTEPYVTDGTPAGTTFLGELRPGVVGTSPRGGIAIGNRILFGATSAAGSELFETDGTPAGTRLFKDINPGPGSSYPSYFVRFGGRIFFRAFDPSHGEDLWVTDGTIAGTKPIDWVPGPYSGNFGEPVVLGNQILFIGRDPAHGFELRITDGTAAGTRLLKDINPGARNTSFGPMVVVGSRAFFMAANPSALWVTDGTPAGTVPVTNVQAQMRSRSMVPFGRGILFIGYTGATGYELWASDGTAAGTRLVKEINPGTANGLRNDLYAFGGRVWFWANDGVHGRELWVSDGTTGGTRLLKDVDPGRNGAAVEYPITQLGGLVYFPRSDPAHGQELWQTDGTTAGTRLTADLQPGTDGSWPRLLGTVGGRLVFGATTPLSKDEPMAMLPGQPPVLLKDIGPSVPASSLPRAGVAFDDGRVLVIASTKESGNGPNGALVRTDGTPGGTTVIKEVEERRNTPFRWWSVMYRGRAYFQAETTAHGEELWVSDGTAAGTRLFRDFLVGPNSSRVVPVRVFRDRLLLRTTFPSSQLYATDGTAAGTRVLVNRPASVFRRVGDWLYLTVGAGSEQKEIWRTDGTPGGTRLVMPTFDVGGFPIGVLGGKFLFGLRDSTHGDELWISDLTRAGTRLVKDIEPGRGSSDPSGGPVIGSRMLLVARTATTGRELFATDGTAAGTQLLKDIHPGTRDGNVYDFVAVEGQVFFSASNPTHGRELWRTDGTVAGTRLVKDIRPGPASGLSWMGPAADGRRILFVADDGTTGRELWISDGTPGGTRPLPEIVPGPGSSDPQYLFVGPEHIYFSATTPSVGEELFAVSRRQLGAGAATPYGFGCAGTGGFAPQMSGIGNPAIGTAGYTVQLSDGRPRSVCGMAIGGRRAKVPFGAQCHLWIDPLALLVFGTTDGAGEYRLTGPIPNQPALVGASVFFTGFVEDPQGAFGGVLSLANGLHVVMGR